MNQILGVPIYVYGNVTQNKTTPTSFLFVSHRNKDGDRIVEASHLPHIEDMRGTFMIEASEYHERYRIRCPAYDNRYLFFSWDKEGRQHLVEAKQDKSDPRSIFNIGRLGPNIYTVMCQATHYSFLQIPDMRDGDDYYVTHGGSPTILRFFQNLVP